MCFFSSLDSEKFQPGINCKIVKPVEIPQENDPNYEYPKPENPLTLPPKIATTPKPVKPTEIPQLPPCPIDIEEFGNDYDSIEVRKDSELVPGVTCKKLPPCSEPDDFGFGIRQEEIPGVTCVVLSPPQENDPNSEIGTTPKPSEPTEIPQLPPCPPGIEEIGADYDSIEVRKDTRLVPGVTCRKLPLCSEPEDFGFGLRQAEKIPGVTCLDLPPPTDIPELPPCPYLGEEEGYDIDLRSDDIPGVTCKELPFCPLDDEEYEEDDFAIDLRKNSEIIPGVTCRPLPLCPYLNEEEGYDIDLRNDIIPGVTCKELPPCPTILVDYEEDSSQLDLRKNTELIPGVSCRPLPPCPLNFDQVSDSRNQLKPGKMRH